MSHFTVLVTADNRPDLEAKLLPYHEHGWGADVDDRAYLVFKSTGPGDPEEWDEKQGDYGYWYNPNAKWDWWTVGGRWSGLLHLKPLETREASDLEPCNGFTTGEMNVLLDLYRRNRDKFMDTVRKYAGKEAEILKYVQTLDRGTVEFFPKEGIGNGSGGLFNKSNSEQGKADYAPAGFINWDGMLQSQLEHKMKTWNMFHGAIREAKRMTRPVMRPEDYELVISRITKEQYHVAKARELYQEDSERGKICRKAYHTEHDFVVQRVAAQIMQERHDWFSMETYTSAANRFYDTEKEHRARFQGDALTYAFVDLEGGWNGKAEMGWFGMSHNEDTDYNKAFWMFVQSLPDDQRVYVVDCHI